jgi:hypothetical protein
MLRPTNGPTGAGLSATGSSSLPAPKGIIFSDLKWITQVAKRYQIENLDLTNGSVVLERVVAAGGRCFCYPDGSWIVTLSLTRLQRCGRGEMEEVLAHELLHAWLWSKHRYAGHGPVFAGHASARGIPRWCSAMHEVRRQGPQQLRLFDA